MTRYGLILGLSVLVAPCGGCGSDDSGGAPHGELICQTTIEDCISIFEGTYSGTYSGDSSGTWTVFIAEDGSVQGTVTDASGNEVAVTGSVDETGTVQFGASGGMNFQGAIDFDENADGIWSGSSGKGSFTGGFTSRDNTLGSSETGSSGSGSSGSGSSGTGGAGGGDAGGGSAETYCDRAAAKAAECGIETTGMCAEPVSEEDKCLSDCTLSLSCAELQSLDALLGCQTSCSASSGERDYCGEYNLKVGECNFDSLGYFDDLCLTGANPENECRWACILDASCAEFMDETALTDACNAECAMP